MLERVFSPVSVGQLQLPHRIMMGSMHLNREDDPRALAAFYRERAAGGAALIVTGGAAVSRMGAGGPNYLLINEPTAAALLSPTLAAVHGAGGKIALQLFHAGRYAFESTYGIRPAAPSEVHSGFSRVLPAALVQEQIEATLADFAAAAATAQSLGFDAVEIMGSEGYLINQFASPLTNLRTDAWGGDRRRRQQFPLAVLAAVRSAVGPAYPIIYRTSGADLVPGSSTTAESRDLATALAAAGADALNIGIGWHESRVPTVQALVPHGHWMGIAGSIRAALADAGVPVPVIGSNRINSLHLAEQALAAGQADVISMARPFLADPRIVAKTRHDQAALVNTCIACNEACIDRSLGTEPVSCMVNPRAGREGDFPVDGVPSAPRPALRVAVVGAGPAGLQAAATLAQAGLPVDLYEEGDGIGGQFRLAGRVPGKEDFLQTIRYFHHELRRLQVRVFTGVSPGPEALPGYAHVILATGVRPRPVALPRTGGLPVRDYREAFAGPDKLGRRVVVIGAGGIAVDLARLLTGINGGPPEVTVLRRGQRIGEGIGPSTRWAVLQELTAAGVRLLPGTTPLEVTPDGLVVANRSGTVLLPADAVVLAAGQVPHNPLHAALLRRGIPCTVIGGAFDASGLNAVRAFDQGLTAGAAVARSLLADAGIKRSRTPLP